MTVLNMVSRNTPCRVSPKLHRFIFGQDCKLLHKTSRKRTRKLKKPKKNPKKPNLKRYRSVTRCNFSLTHPLQNPPFNPANRHTSTGVIYWACTRQCSLIPTPCSGCRKTDGTGGTSQVLADHFSPGVTNLNSNSINQMELAGKDYTLGNRD